MSGCGHEELAPDCLFCGTDGMTADDIIAGQKAFELKMKKAKAWDELEEWLETQNYEVMWLNLKGQMDWLMEREQE